MVEFALPEFHSAFSSPRNFFDGLFRCLIRNPKVRTGIAVPGKEFHKIRPIEWGERIHPQALPRSCCTLARIASIFG